MTNGSGLKAKSKMKIYDPTFSERPSYQGQLYQLCDINIDFVKEKLSDMESVSRTCTKETGWLTRDAFDSIKDIM
jgi:hypothetical protein